MWDIKSQPWCDLETLSIGREPTHTHFLPFQSALAAQSGERALSTRVTCLNGDWRFRWFASPLSVDARVIAEPTDSSHGYADIRVPRNWQFAGYGSMLYTDEAFPFPIDPPYIPGENETGVYKRTFSWVPSADKRLFIRFEGVESAFSLYVNGVFVGYSQGSRMPSEFELTTHTSAGENTLCVVVYQYCDGTYLEDQDMWWLGGIIRDVLLLERPRSYLKNLVCDADYDAATGEGSLTVQATVAGEAQVRLTLADPQGQVVAEDVLAQSGQTVLLRVPSAAAWNAEQPNLYQLVATVLCQGNAVEATQQRVGLRRVEIREGTLLLNGRRIMMRGVNRHEFDPHNGRAIDKAQTEHELLLIKRAGMNAVRTSHYPNIPEFYDLCDAIGLYVIDECDLETHGFEIEGNPTRLANDPAWEAAYIERAERMVGRDRNHACVLLWSLGNESSYGRNFAAMYRYIKQVDPSRPVHYEPDDRCVSTDVSSTMYTTVGMLHERDLELSPKRPHILCEFAHAMGNGPGSLAQYIATCESSHRIQGYFVWELKDHGVYTRRADGSVCYRYGGEFGEDYTSGNFCMDGLLFADGTPSPGFWEYQQLIAPIQLTDIDPQAHSVQAVSRWDFAPMVGVTLHGTLLRDGVEMAAWTQEMPMLAAREKQAIALAEVWPRQPLDNALWTMSLTCRLGEDKGCMPAGQVMGSAQVVLRNYAAIAEAPRGTVRVEQTADRIVLQGEDCSLAISLIDGSLRDYISHGVLRLTKGPQLNFFRAYLDNDRKLSGAWQEQHLHSMRMTVREAKVEQQGDVTCVRLKGTYAPNARNWRVAVDITYWVDAAGRVKVSFAGDFNGDLGNRMPVELPKLGTRAYLPKPFDIVTYSGLGPNENYCDSHAAARKGLYSADIASMQVPYECPQDNGNRFDVDFVAMTDAAGEGITFASLVPRDMSVRAQEDVDLWRAAHRCDVPERDYHVLHFDVRNSGLGSGSCGPNHLAQHAVFTQPFAFAFAIAPVRAGDTIAQARVALGFLQALESEEEKA